MGRTTRKTAAARTALLALLTAGGFGVAGCSAPVLEVGGRAQLFSLDGEVGASTSSISGSTSTDSLGLDDDEVEPVLYANFEFGPWAITADAFNAGFEGSGTLEADLSLGGIDLTVGDPVDTKVDLGYARGLLTWDLLPTDMFELGIGLGAGYTDFSGEITDTVLDITESTDETLIFPVGALRGGVRLNDLSAMAVVSGIGYSYDDTELSVIDADLGASWRFISASGGSRLAGILQAGYRYIAIDAEFDSGGDDVEADIDLSGPYLGLAISF